MLVKATLSRTHIATAASTVGALLFAGLAAALFTGGPWSAAVAMLMSPMDVEAASADAERLVREEDYAAAVPIYEKLYLRDRRNPDVEVKLASALMHAGRVADAKKRLLALNKREPLHAETWIVLGICQQKDVEYDRALGSFRAALNIKPDSWEANYRMGLVLKDTERTREAPFYFHRCIQIDPARPLAHYALAMTLAKAGDHAGAAEAYAAAAKGYKDDLRLHLFYAQSLLKINRVREARVQLQVAESIDPTHPAVIDARKQISLAR